MHEKILIYLSLQVRIRGYDVLTGLIPVIKLNCKQVYICIWWCLHDQATVQHIYNVFHSVSSVLTQMIIEQNVSEIYLFVLGGMNKCASCSPPHVKLPYTKWASSSLSVLIGVSSHISCTQGNCSLSDWRHHRLSDNTCLLLAWWII